jgi:sugar phosphate permease
MEKEQSEQAAWGVVAALIVGYIGIYLCRKNLSVALPLLQDTWHLGKAQVGIIASASTVAYAVGKLLNGAIVDRIGGRAGFLLALLGVALFGIAGALAPGLGALTLFYSLNRYSGSAGWGSMVKLMPTWFRPIRMATVIGILSMGYVFGGVAAPLLAATVEHYGGGWRAVMGVPSLVLLGIAAVCVFVVRRGPLHPDPAPADGTEVRESATMDDEVNLENWEAIFSLFHRPRFLVVCGLSFVLTLVRESFNTWSVDYLTSIQGGTKSVALAAVQSTGFDLAGAVSILAMGVVYDRARPESRRWLVAGILAMLTVVIAALPGVGRAHPVTAAWLVGLVGLLVYGPYSLLSGVMAVESGGPRLAATAAGIIDSCGYVAGILAGYALGRLLDLGGYSLGFLCLAILTANSAFIALGIPRTAANR